MRRARVLAVAVAVLAVLAGARGNEARADEKGECSAKYQSAQRSRAAGKLTLARADLLRCAEPTCPTFVSNDCKTWLAEVDDELPTLVYAVLDSNGGDVPNGVIRVDGVAVPSATDGLGHAVDPGEHLVEARAGGESLRQQIIVRVGERARRIELRLAVDPSPLGESGSTPAVRGRSPLGAYVLGGVGVAAIAVGTALWITGSNAARTYNASCESTGCTEDERDSAHRQLVAGDILWGAGLAAGIGAVAVLLTHRSPAASPMVSFGPSGVSVSGSF